MACPVCDGTDVTVVNIRMKEESNLKQLVGEPWDGQNMARCDECGVLYDHQLTERDAQADTRKLNCPECGSRTDATSDTCSYCGTNLE